MADAARRAPLEPSTAPARRRRRPARGAPARGAGADRPRDRGGRRGAEAGCGGGRQAGGGARRARHGWATRPICAAARGGSASGCPPRWSSTRPPRPRRRCGWHAPGCACGDRPDAGRRSRALRAGRRRSPSTRPLVRAPAGVAGALVWRTRPAVVIGRFQRADWEIDAAACAAPRRARVAPVHRRRRRATSTRARSARRWRCPGAPSATPRRRPRPVRPAARRDGAACRALGVDATRDERTVRVGGRKVTGIAAHRGRRATLVHGTLLVDADLDGLRACLAGPRGGSLDGPAAAGAQPARPRRQRRRRHRRRPRGRRRGVRGARARREEPPSPRELRAGRRPPARALRRPRVACRTMARRHLRRR